MQEIVAVARRHLTAGEGLVLRAVATEIGMTAAGLYRYVDNIRALSDLVADTVTDELLEQFERTSALHDADPAARWALFCAHLRVWGVTAPAEALLVMAPAGGAFGAARLAQAPRAGSSLRRLRARFDELLVPLVDTSGAGPPTPGSELCGPLGTVLVPVVADDAWVRLCGFVTLETLGTLDTRDAGPAHRCQMFRDAMHDLTGRVGLASHWPRLHALARTVLDGPPAHDVSYALTHLGGHRV